MSVLLFIIGVLAVAIGIIVSIALHEIGHLVPAKLFKVRVTQYMVGFGRTLFSVRRGETEYGIKAIPAGGYVSMIGMFPPQAEGDGKVRTSTTGMFQTMVDEARKASNAEVRPEDNGRMFYQLPIWKRIIIMLGGPAMNFLLAIILVGIALTGFGAATATTTVSELNKCVITAEQQERTGQTDCLATDKPSPALAAGLEPGDTIVAIDGQNITSWTQLTNAIRERAGREVPIVIDRGGETKDLTITPVVNDVVKLDDDGRPVIHDGQPETVRAGFIGVAPTNEMVPQPASAVLPAVGDNISAVFNVVIHLPQRMVEVGRAAFTDEPRDPNGPISVVGVGRIAGEVAATDQINVTEKVAGLVGLLASVNIALGVFNLIPLLPLDGGHVAGALWEGLRRNLARILKRRDPGPFDIAKLMPLTYVVAGLLIAMGALLIFADIVKPISIF